MASSRSIQGYEKSAKWLIEYGIELKHAALHNLVSGVAAGLDQLIRTRGRAHGNLSPATILISGPRRLSRAGVALADPPGDAPALEADDLYAIGLLIFRLVTHEQFNKVDNYPIDPNRFAGLRRHVDAWCSLCGRLLDPDASQRLTKLSDLVAALEKMKPRLPRPPRWLIIALVVGLAGYFIGQAVVGWRDRSALASLKNDPWFGEFARLVAQEDTRKTWEGDPTLKAIIDNCKDVGLLSGGAKRPPWERDKEVGKQTGPWFEPISLSWSGKWNGQTIRPTVDTAREALTKAKSDLGPKTWKPVTSSDPRLSRLVAATIDPTRKGDIVQPAQITKVLDLKSKIPDLEKELKSFDTVLVGELSTLKDRVDFGDDANTFRNNLSNARTSIPAALETVPGDSGIVTAIIADKHRNNTLIASATLLEDLNQVCANVVKWRTDVTEKQTAFVKAANSLGITVTVPAPATQPAEGFEKACRALADELSSATILLVQVKRVRDEGRKLLEGDSDPDGLSDFMADELLGPNDLGSLKNRLSTVRTVIGDIHSYVDGNEVEWVVFADRWQKVAATQPATSPSEWYQRWTTLAEECRRLKPDEKTRFENMLLGWPDRFKQVDKSIKNANIELATRKTELQGSFDQIKAKLPCQLTLKERPGELTTLEAEIECLAVWIDVAVAGTTVWSQAAAGINTAVEAGKKMMELGNWALEDAATNDWSTEFKALANTTRCKAAQSLVPADWTKLADWTKGFEEKFGSANFAYKEWHKKLTPLSDGWSLICRKLSGQYLTSDEQNRVTDEAKTINTTADGEVKGALSRNPIWPQVELLLTVAGETDRKKLSTIGGEIAVNLAVVRTLDALYSRCLQDSGEPAVMLAVLRKLDASPGDSFQDRVEFDLAGQLLTQLDGEARRLVLAEVKQLWTARASKIGTLKDLESAIASKKKFLLDDDPWFLTDKRVSAAIRHDLLLYSLNQALDKNLEEVVKKLIENGNEPPGGPPLSTLKGKLKDVLNSDSATQPVTPASQPTNAGPVSDQAKVKWTLQKTEQDGVLKFTWSSPQNKEHTLFFRHVKTADGPGAYLCTTEMSVGLFADIDTEARAKWPQNEKANLKTVHERAKGVRTWWLDEQLGSIMQREQWMPKLGTFEEKYYAPAFKNDGLRLRPGDAPTSQHPIQHLPPEAAARLAELLDCRLPTVKEWQAAKKEWQAANDKMLPGAKPNLRDLTWQEQVEYILKLRELPPREAWLNAPNPSSGSYSPNPQAPGDIWDQNANGEFVVGGPAPTYNDRFLWFDKVCPNPATATDFYHLIGNVAEFVTDKPLPLGENGNPQKQGVKVLIVGASALSAPNLNDLTLGADVIPKNPWKIDEAFSDVGFRLAFSAPPAKSPLRAFIAQAKYVLANDATPP